MQTSAWANGGLRMPPLHAFVFVLLPVSFSFQQRCASAPLPNLVNSSAECLRVKRSRPEGKAGLLALKFFFSLHAFVLSETDSAGWLAGPDLDQASMFACSSIFMFAPDFSPARLNPTRGDGLVCASPLLWMQKAMGRKDPDRTLSTPQSREVGQDRKARSCLCPFGTLEGRPTAWTSEQSDSACATGPTSIHCFLVSRCWPLCRQQSLTVPPSGEKCPVKS